MVTLQSVLPGCVSCCSGSVPAEAGAWPQQDKEGNGHQSFPNSLSPPLDLPPALQR